MSKTDQSLPDLDGPPFGFKGTTMNCSKSRVGNSPPGWTVVELMVALIIIGALAVLLFGAVQQTRQTAATAGCLSKLRNLWVVHRQFRSEVQESLCPDSKGFVEVMLRAGCDLSPDDTMCPATTASTSEWLEDHIPNVGVWYSEYMYVGAKDDPRRYAWSKAQGKPTGYAANGSAFYNRWTRKSYREFIGYEARIPLFLDGVCYAVMASSDWNTRRDTQVAYRHHQKANFIFLDGHSEAWGPERVSSWRPATEPLK